MTVEEAKKYMAEGEFPAGSMLPKIEAAVQFAESKKRTENPDHPAGKGSRGNRGQDRDCDPCLISQEAGCGCSLEGIS